MQLVALGPRKDPAEVSSGSGPRILIRPSFNIVFSNATHFVFTIVSSETQTQMTDQKIDLLFVVDSSDSVGRANFLKSKAFVKAFARAFKVAPDKTHVAFIRFGDVPELSIRFGEHTSIEDFNRAVDNVRYVGGTKRLDKALVLAARVLPKARPSSKKIAIIISDGKQTLQPGVEPLDFAAQPLHGIGAKVYVIGTGQNVDIPKLQLITQKPGDLFISRSYDDLLWQILSLMRHMTKGKIMIYKKKVPCFHDDITPWGTQ
jgi:hypothetical protein